MLGWNLGASTRMLEGIVGVEESREEDSVAFCSLWICRKLY